MVLKGLKRAKVPDTPSKRFSIRPQLPGGHAHYIEPKGYQDRANSWKKFLGGGKQTSEKEALNSVDTMVEKYGRCHEVVGSGATGTVWLSRKKTHSTGSDALHAIKCVRRVPTEPKEKYSKRLQAEFAMSKQLDHENVVRTLGLFKGPSDDYCKAMEFCAGGDLYMLVHTAGRLEEQEADCFFKQLICGVEYLHEMGVSHRDLKPENLLLTRNGQLKISDFDCSECIRLAWETEARPVSGLCGSEPYIAPEAFLQEEFDGRALDIWACGIIYMAMATGKLLWNIAQKDEDSIYTKYLEDRRGEDGFAPIESLPQEHCRNVLYCILDPRPSRRITVSQLLRSPWVRGIQVCCEVSDS
ncbi:hypothetical protein V2G26_010672 [Clonostachys chloroleuca]